MDLQEPIWEKQKGETSIAFHLFTLYRDLGPLRTLPQVQLKYTKNTGKTRGIDQLHKYSTANLWVKRCDAYDIHLDKILLKEHEDAVKEMGERHSTLAQKFQKKIERMADDPALDGADVTKSAWAINTHTHSLVKLAMLERLSLGEATSKAIVEADVTGDITSDNVFDHVDKILKHVNKGNEDGDK